MREDVKKNIDKAVDLRINQKMSYADIAVLMNRPVGTVKRWLAPYRTGFTKDSKESLKIAGIKGSLKMQENYANLRRDAYESAKQNIEEDLKDKLLRDFINIYIGEGSKRSRNTICIVNSDPKIILLSLTVIKKYFLKNDKKIILEIRHYKENNNEEELLEYWKNLLNNDQSISFKTYLQPTIKVRGHNNSNKFGLVFAYINDTYAKQKLDAYMDYLKEEWTKEFEIVFNTKVDRSITEVKAK